MNNVEYKKLIKDTINYFIPEYNLQKILNNLRDNGIATYNEKDKNKILIKGIINKNDRINKCLDNDNGVFYIIEDILIKKAYRYSIYYSCDDFTMPSNLKDEYLMLENFKKENLHSIKDFNKPIIVEDEEYVAIKFHKSINPFINKIDKTKDVLYSTLWVYHKKLKVLEHRFDMLGFKADDNFYETTFKPQISKICKDFKCKYYEFRTSSIIKFIVENKKDEVHEIAQYMGLRQNSLAKLKAGETLIMPFLGDLEILMQQNKELFNKNSETEEIYKLLDRYISGIKRNANYKSRLLEWFQNKEYNPCVNILFSYREKNYDLFNFQEPKKINMEVMNYVINYIWRIKRDLE